MVEGCTVCLPVSLGRDTESRWSLYLVYMPREVKDPTQGNGKNCELSMPHTAGDLDL